MTKMRTIQSGKIWESRRTREVLWSLMKLRNIHNGVLRISSPRTHLEGDIGISKGIYVTGAKLKSSQETGYGAVRKLLSVTDGTFTYLDNGENGLGELDQNLHLRVTQLINLLPNLPANHEELMGKNTLNRIRAVNLEQEPAEEQAIDAVALQQLEEWEKKSMRWRAVTFWGLFAAVSVIAGLIYYVQK